MLYTSTLSCYSQKTFFIFVAIRDVTSHRVGALAFPARELVSLALPQRGRMLRFDSWRRILVALGLFAVTVLPMFGLLFVLQFGLPRAFIAVWGLFSIPIYGIAFFSMLSNSIRRTLSNLSLQPRRKFTNGCPECG